MIEERESKAPSEVLDALDPGDDVQLRFRYQHAFAAIQCAKLLQPSCEFVAVYCENHEDVLLEKRDGRFIGVQVKTRKFDGEPFKSTDPAVIKSISRFAKLEGKFPGKFVAFHFVTNHSFWNEYLDHHCLSHITERVRARGGTRGLPKTNPIRAYVLEICEKCGCSEEDVSQAISKLTLVSHESDLEKTCRDLIEVVAETDNLEFESHTVVRGIANDLLFRTYEASSRKLGGDSGDLYDLASDFDAHRTQLLLKGKTIASEAVKSLIDKWKAEAAGNLLVSANLTSKELLPPGADILTEKLERGELQAGRVNKVRDYKASMENLYFKWKYKYNLDEANKRLTHIKTLVDDDCVEAKIAAEAEGLPFASRMYTELRRRLTARIQNNTQPLFGATEEHLVGAAGILTEECHVWWSPTFELRSKTST